MHLGKIISFALMLLLVSCGRKESQPLIGLDFTTGDWLMVYVVGGESTCISDRSVLQQHQGELRSLPECDPSCTTPQSLVILYKDGARVSGFPACDHLNIDFGKLESHFRPVERHDLAFTNHDQFLSELSRLKAEESTYVVPPESTERQFDGLLRITLMFDRDLDDEQAAELITNEFKRLYHGIDCRTEVFNSSISFNPIRKGYWLKVYCDLDTFESFDADKILGSDAFDHAHVGDFERHSYELAFYTY